MHACYRRERTLPSIFLSFLPAETREWHLTLPIGVDRVVLPARYRAQFFRGWEGQRLPLRRPTRRVLPPRLPPPIHCLRNLRLTDDRNEVD